MKCSDYGQIDWQRGRPLRLPWPEPTAPSMTPTDRMTPAAEALARDPSVMLDGLAKALVAIKGPAQAARILRLAADAAERMMK
jgi:hypothetical protein